MKENEHKILGFVFVPERWGQTNEAKVKMDKKESM